MDQGEGPKPCSLDAVPIAQSFGIDEFDATQTTEIGRLLIDRIVLQRGPLQAGLGEAYALLIVGIDEHAVMCARRANRTADASANSPFRRIDRQASALVCGDVVREQIVEE